MGPYIGDDTGEVDYQGLTPCFGLCCATYNCYTDFPECFGTYQKGEICCISGEVMLCKCGKESKSY